MDNIEQIVSLLPILVIISALLVKDIRSNLSDSILLVSSLIFYSIVLYYEGIGKIKTRYLFLSGVVVFIIIGYVAYRHRDAINSN